MREMWPRRVARRNKRCLREYIMCSASWSDGELDRAEKPTMATRPKDGIQWSGTVGIFKELKNLYKDMGIMDRR